MVSRRSAAGALAAAGLGGCAVLASPSRIRMDVQYDDNGCVKTQASVLLVLLPGANMALAELQREGFVAAVRRRGLAVDVRLADANLGYARDGSMLRHLEDDVIGPARDQGYRRIWLAGISLGGFVALGYTLHHPDQIEGLCLIAPYLGKETLLREIEAAGGPAAWARQAAPAQPDDIERRVWQWLAAPPAGAPPLWLGYGSDDRLAEGHRLLAGILPPDRVASAPGGHDWPPWRALWSQWLDRGLLPAACPA